VAGAALLDVERREHAAIGELAIEVDLEVAGALELDMGREPVSTSVRDPEQTYSLAERKVRQHRREGRAAVKALNKKGRRRSIALHNC
jgi:hypothetical protein